MFLKRKKQFSQQSGTRQVSLDNPAEDIPSPDSAPEQAVAIMSPLARDAGDETTRLFSPDEWKRFFENLKTSQKMTFDMLINTRARYKEVFNIKVKDCDLEHGIITIRIPDFRTISISSQFNKKLALYIKQRKLKNDDYLNLLSRPAAHICLKTTLKRIGVKDWQKFTLENIRQTPPI